MDLTLITITDLILYSPNGTCKAGFDQSDACEQLLLANPQISEYYFNSIVEQVELANQKLSKEAAANGLVLNCLFIILLMAIINHCIHVNKALEKLE